MIKSLTGFGNIDINDESTQLNIIIRSVNSRFLDIKFRGIELKSKVGNGYTAGNPKIIKGKCTNSD